jgi:hypothetical protein
MILDLWLEDDADKYLVTWTSMWDGNRHGTSEPTISKARESADYSDSPDGGHCYAFSIFKLSTWPHKNE